MPKLRKYGSVREVTGSRHPYRDRRHSLAYTENFWVCRPFLGHWLHKEGFLPR